jgi:hypothetical protein
LALRRGLILSVACIYAAGCEDLPKPTGAVGPGVLVASGLTGTWAVDCASDASRNNPYIIYSVPDTGEPAEQFLARDPRLDRTTRMRDIRALEGQKVAWTQRVADKTVDVIVQVEAQKQRVWRSVLSDGTIFIADGRFGSGQDTPWFNKCAGGSSQ